MRDAAPPIIDRIARKLRVATLYPRYRRYLSGIDDEHPLHGIPTRLVGDASADPTEFFDHYDAFAFWAARKIHARGGRQKTLDLGSTKMMNGILSTMHDVTAMVLANCHDQLSEVRYVRHDVCDPLPFAAVSFDVFTSMASLPLIGLGRYGDRLDPDCLERFVAELGRVMKPDADLLISMCLGPNVLNFNNGWFLDMETIARLFGSWRIVDQLVDGMSSPDATPNAGARFSKDASVERIRFGDYRVVFLHFRRADA
jgi:SAM-dependent methyltransferase